MLKSRNRWSSYMFFVLWVPCRNCMWYKGVIVSICVSKRLINYKGVVSSVTVITTRAKDVWGEIAHTMDNLIEQGKFKLESLRKAGSSRIDSELCKFCLWTSTLGPIGIHGHNRGVHAPLKGRRENPDSSCFSLTDQRSCISHCGGLVNSHLTHGIGISAAHDSLLLSDLVTFHSSLHESCIAHYSDTLTALCNSTSGRKH